MLLKVDDPLVVLGPPGCGKSTLLRRLELISPSMPCVPAEGRISMFLLLSRYRAGDDGILPSPREWVAREWQRPCTASRRRWQNCSPAGVWCCCSTPSMKCPTPATLTTAHASSAGASSWRISCAMRRARGWCSPAAAWTTARPERQQGAAPCADQEPGRSAGAGNSSAYIAPITAPLWCQLEGTPQPEVLRSPSTSSCWSNSLARRRTAQAGRAGLFTHFVRQTLLREIEVVRNPLFQPDDLLSRRDYACLARHEGR